MGDQGITSSEFDFRELDSFTNEKQKFDSLINKYVYVKNQDGKTWSTAKIYSRDENNLYTATGSNGTVYNVQYDDLVLVNKRVQSDTCDLEYINEPGIVANLGQRFLDGIYYTEMNNDMIFVNPYEYIHDDHGKNHAYVKDEPDVTNVAYNAYMMMNFGGAKQSIVFNGLSGSGKT